MRRGGRGFRLGNAESYNLQWFHCQSAADIAGIGAQVYEPSGGASSSPDRLFLQERLVGFEETDIDRANRMVTIAWRMAKDPEGDGTTWWRWLKRVYGPLSSRDPHDEFGRELAPLVRLTPAVLSRAEKHWPHWHLKKRSREYGALYAQLRRELGAGADVERLMRLIPDDAGAAGEAEEVVSDVLDGACLRSREARKYNQVLVPADEHMLRLAEAQADQMLADAGLAYMRAADAVADDAREGGARSAVVRDREAARESLETVESIGRVIDGCDRLLEVMRARPRSVLTRECYWAEKRARASALAGESPE